MPGGSAQQQYERIRDERRAELRRRRPWIVGLSLGAAVVAYAVFEALMDTGELGVLIAVLMILPTLLPTQREAAWRRGAEGERIVGGALDALGSRGLVVLHDRLIPRSRANIDHIAVGPRAVHTIDAKRYTGRIEVRRGRLFVKGRDRSKLLDQARRQRVVVSDALAAGGYGDVVVTPVLCFTGVEWPLLFPPRRVGDVLLCSPKGLPRALGVALQTAPSPHTKAIADHLARTLKPAVASGTPAVPDGRSAGRPPSREPAPRAAAAATPRRHTVSSRCQCGQAMLVRTRRADGTRFLGCSTFPACRHTRPLADEG
jgi:hypothetical protein